LRIALTMLTLLACTPGHAPLEPTPVRSPPRAWPATPLDITCAIDPVTDIATLDADPHANIAYRSGNSEFSYRSPTMRNGKLGHHQGIGRMYINEGVDRGNYFVVSASTHNVDPGFEVVQIASNDSPGALGSLASPRAVSRRNDRIVNWVTFDNAWLDTNYNHAGGLQVLGHIVAVPLESYKVDSPDDASFVLWQLRPRFAEMSEPVQRRNSSEHGSTEHAGSIGMTRLGDGRYLVMVFGRHAREVEVFISTGGYLPWASDDWASAGAWDVSQEAGTVVSEEEWPAYQGTQLFPSCDGKLYLLAGKRIDGNDWVHLWSVDLDEQTLRPTFTRRAQRHLFCSSKATRGYDYCDFSAGSGGYVDPAGHLIVYGVEGTACVAGDCDHRRRGDGNHVGVREFAPHRSTP